MHLKVKYCDIDGVNDISNPFDYLLIICSGNVNVLVKICKIVILLIISIIFFLTILTSKFLNSSI